MSCMSLHTISVFGWKDGGGGGEGGMMAPFGSRPLIARQVRNLARI